MIRSEFKEYLTMDLGYTEEVAIQAFNIATAECKRMGYSKQLITVETMTRNILEGRYRPEKYNPDVERCEWCGLPQGGDCSCDHCSYFGSMEVSDQISSCSEEEVYLNLTDSVAETLDLIFGDIGLEWREGTNLHRHISNIVGMRKREDFVKSLNDEAESDRLAAVIAYMEKYNTIIIRDLLESYIVSDG